MNATNNVPAARIINNVNVTALASGVRGALAPYRVRQHETNPFAFTVYNPRPFTPGVTSLTVGGLRDLVLRVVPNAKIGACIRGTNAKVLFTVNFPNPARECTDVAYM
jgi:hypothetical protein